MRLLFVIDCLGSGGAQRQMVNLAIYLQARQHQVDLFVYYPTYRHFAEQLHEAGIPVHAYQKQGRYDLRPMYRIRNLLQSGRYELALAFLPTPSFYLEWAAIDSQIPTVVSERSAFRSSRLGFGQWLLQQSHRLADRITVNSHHQHDRMVQTFAWMQPKLSVIYNGTDLRIFRPRHEESTGRGGLFKINFLVLGSVVPNKNPLGLVNGLIQFRQSYPEYADYVHICWAGKIMNDLASQEEYRRVSELIAQFGLHNSWQWLGERTDVAELLRSSDALIHPAFFEGLPNAICEALASGLPVLASDIGDHARLIRSGDTGFLFSPTDSSTIANAIYQICKMPDQDRASMSRKARQFAEENLSIDQFVRAYEHLFAQLLTEKKAP